MKDMFCKFNPDTNWYNLNCYFIALWLKNEMIYQDNIMYN